MSTGAAVLAWLALALGVVVLGVVALLLDRVLRPIREIRRYADAVLVAGVGIAKNVDGVDEAVRTRDLATAVPGLARGFLERAGR